MRKPTICIGENKAADQLRNNCEADQLLCFRYSDSTVPLLLKSEIPIFQLSSVTVQPDLCQASSESTLLVFPRDVIHLRLIYVRYQPMFLQSLYSWSLSAYQRTQLYLCVLLCLVGDFV